MRGHTNPRKRNSVIWYFFLLPTFMGILLFMVYPVMESFRLSFYHAGGAIETWAGLDNYKTVLSSNVFWQAVFNTFYMGFFQLLLTIPLGFILATLINELKWGKNFFKVMFFIPYITSVVAASMLFLFVLHPDFGLLNYFLSKLGLPTSVWLAEPASARWGAILLGSWHWLGFVIIIFLANLQAISEDIYEAGAIDGATGFQKWRYLTIPNMTGTFSFLIVIGWIGSLQRFTDIYLLGGIQGSPARSLYTIVGFIYERGFGGTEYGVASAAAYVLFAMILFFTALNLKITKMKI
ncbi:sugar ABC transporter permease [Paenibacillus sp. SYP-B3998]|uniref:Sugar ABC transporter permease n=1 Tax=Paenibacillus sp. SYP-B3998 TaxID=2678564 RepID=A0A6G3ZRH9_9BACL|nr:sugar ABC transporter permease [Paenibacillus sp. SYP-B3998]NEW04813.1 sugar ABC transporter permease [Paenibacillus sp. SYP-B3998]